MDATASVGANIFGPDSDCDTPLLTSLSYNVTTDADCFTATTGDQVVADSMLGPLASNGGPTQTMALLPGSPALDVVPAGTLECGAGLTEDQRGETRPQGAKCDAGAYEQVVLTDTATDDQRSGFVGLDLVAGCRVVPANRGGVGPPPGSRPRTATE